jgi:hypothetical protein
MLDRGVRISNRGRCIKECTYPLGFSKNRLDFSEDLHVDHALEQRTIAQLAEI